MLINVQTLIQTPIWPDQIQLFEQFLVELGQDSVELTEKMAQKMARYGLDVHLIIEESKLPFTGRFQNKDSTKYWYQNGQLHREDGPAVEQPNGTRYWYWNGQPHRENGPAEEWAGGLKKWYWNGQLHREDGPAVEWPNGTKYWYQNGQLKLKAPTSLTGD